ncbi:hypothetical protein [Streptomyces sp. NRRL S-241]|uniref:hypothetical protein n=1 Tax=Streptomyces sp. NRRL S-241 TaxID=1463896 RepID=UPI0004BFBE1C|nr:hypothetical protein [Streptomyces sp. NRRL S-241]
MGRRLRGGADRPHLSGGFGVRSAPDPGTWPGSPLAPEWPGPVLLTVGADEEGETLPLDKDKVLAMLATLTDL